MNPSTKRFQLTSNQLKLLALVTMTCDHVGLLLLPQYRILRIIGRLAFPIFAFMIAEGCRYTSHRARYLGMVFGVGVLCQIVYLIAMRSLYQCILITFSLSIALIYCVRWARERGIWRWCVCLCAFLFVYFLCELLPLRLSGTDYGIDYRFTGVLLPVLIYCFPSRWGKLFAAAVGMMLVSAQMGGIQWFSLAALPLLALYGGQRGKAKLKYLFYIYYPLHLVVIWAIRMLLSGVLK